MRGAWSAPLLVLCGCASISAYDPEAIGAAVKIVDRPAYLADLAECREIASNYRGPSAVGSILSGAGTGAAENASAAVVGGPLVVAVGAAGGASASALGALGGEQMLVLGNCLREESRADRSFMYVGR